MKSLSLKVLAAFRPAQISLLTAAQVTCLSNEQLRGLSAEQVAALSTEVISEMTKEQILALAPEQIAALTDAQLAALGGEQAAALSEAQLALFNKGQLNRLPPEQQARLKGWALARQAAAGKKAAAAEAASAPPPKQAKVVALTRRQLAALPASALSIGVVDPRNPGAGAVPLSQLLEAGLDIPVDALSAEVLATLAPSAAAMMDAASLSKLTKEQVAALVKSGAVKALSSVQLAALKTCAGFAALVASKDKGDAVGAALVAAMEEMEAAKEEVRRVDAKTISKWSAAKLVALSAVQMGAMTREQVAALSGSQLAHISPATLAGMDPEVLATLTAEQVAGLTPEQLAALPSRVLVTLSASALTKLSAEQLAALGPDVILCFDAKQIKALAQVAEKLGDGAAPAHVVAALKEVMAGVTKIEGLTAADMKKLTMAELSKISAAAASALTPEQVAALSPEQLAAMPPEALLALSQKAAAALSEEQTAMLSHAAAASVAVRKMGKGAAALAAVKLTVQWRRRETAPEVEHEEDLAKRVVVPVPLRKLLPTDAGSTQVQDSGEIEEEALARAARAVGPVDYRAAKAPAGYFVGAGGEVDDEPDILVVLVDEAYPGAGGGAPVFGDVDDWAPLTARQSASPSPFVGADGEIVEAIEGPGDGRDDHPALGRYGASVEYLAAEPTSFGLQSILALGIIEEEDGLDHDDDDELDYDVDAWRTPRRAVYDEPVRAPSRLEEVADDVEVSRVVAAPKRTAAPPRTDDFRCPSRADAIDDDWDDEYTPVEAASRAPKPVPNRAPSRIDDDVEDIVDAGFDENVAPQAQYRPPAKPVAPVTLDDDEIIDEEVYSED